MYIKIDYIFYFWEKKIRSLDLGIINKECEGVKRLIFIFIYKIDDDVCFFNGLYYVVVYCNIMVGVKCVVIFYNIVIWSNRIV